MEDITDQVYSLHGISVDKLEGIKSTGTPCSAEKHS